MSWLKKFLALAPFLTCFTVQAQVANRFDVVITEVMADPTPQVGLPNAEYIEIKNISASAFNLNGWKLSDAGATATITASFVLQPDSFLIICANSSVAALSVFGRTIGVAAFPSFDNDGDQLSLRSSQGKTIHALSYTSFWYGNEIKKEGGWSLEMIDTHNPCTGMDNWKASTNDWGGTPGQKNSVDAVNTDEKGPVLLRTFSTDSITLVAVFNEPVDSLSASLAGNYSIENLSVVSATPQAPLLTQTVLKLSDPLQKGRTYTLTASHIKDCHNNPIGVLNKAKAGWAEEALPGDIVVNEILFNPKSNGSDYIEVYNRSSKVVDAGQLRIANRNAAGAIGSIKKFSETPFHIFPGDYLVITEDPSSLRSIYFVEDPDHVLPLSPLPSFPDDKGTVVVTNSQGIVVDEVSYTDKWHFALLSEQEGIALERIDPDGASQDQNNWHSAASTSGYGTPTYKNSQFKQIDPVRAVIEVSPKLFSPDNDGHDDFATISYQAEQPGYVANISIFDANGRLIRYFIKNALLGLKGSWNWDGLNETHRKLPIGIYIIYTEIFNLQGKRQQFKNTVVLGGKP